MSGQERDRTEAGVAVKVVSEGPVKSTKTTIDTAWKRRKKGVRLMSRHAEWRGLALVVKPAP